MPSVSASAARASSDLTAIELTERAIVAVPEPHAPLLQIRQQSGEYKRVLLIRQLDSLVQPKKNSPLLSAPRVALQMPHDDISIEVGLKNGHGLNPCDEEEHSDADRVPEAARPLARSLASSRVWRLVGAGR